MIARAFVVSIWHVNRGIDTAGRSKIEVIDMGEKIRQDIILGRNIRALRRGVRLTQEQVVARLREHDIAISRSIYSQMECGSYNIRVSELAALSDIFNVDYNAFFKNARDGK